MEILLALFGSALLVLLGHWLLLRLLSPAQTGTMPVFAVIPAAGDGEGLEQTLRHLRWLQGEKLAPFTPLVVDAGLSPQGLALVQALQRRDPTLLFCRQRRPHTSYKGKVTMDTSPSELIFLDGTVSAVIYRNEENGYTILRLETTDEGEEVTVVGTMPGINPGEGLSVHGQWTRHSTYGEQFKAEIVERRMPVGEKALLEYLASGAIKGIGAATARRLLDVFGEDILTVIEEDPQQLTKVRGISPKRAETIHQSLCLQLSMRRLLDFLSAHSLPLSIATPLYRRYGDLALNALRANPYLLMEDPLFVSFPAADKLAMDLGFSPEDPLRLEAGILYTLAHNLDNGHVFLPYAKLLAAAQRLLGGEADAVEACFQDLLDQGRIVRDAIAGQDACYLDKLYHCETYVAHALLAMDGGELCPPDDLEELLVQIQRDQGLTYAPLQVEAVKTAARQQVMLLTGGPGTGKTTSLRGILALFDHLGLRTALTAPTGGRPSAWQRPAGRRPPPSTAFWKPGTTATPAASPSPTTNGSPWTPTR